MTQQNKRVVSLLLALVLALSLSVPAFAAVSQDKLAAALTDTAQYVHQTVSSPQVGSIGGEWAVLGLARSGCAVPEAYYQDYYATVEQYVTACKGVLHDKKYTEYSRLIVALSAIGKDARSVAGYDLTYPLGDYDKTIWQGLNGPIWALIALDSRNYPMPQNKEAKTQATRQMYIDRILACQLDDGGWSLFGGTAAASSGDGVSDPDITGMALQALAKYQDQPAVQEATQAALTCMSKQQGADGGFASWGTANSESCVQIIVALCELGIPLDDARFVKNGHTLLDALMTYYLPGSGFQHTALGSGSNQMATEQGFYGLVAAQRAAQGKNSLYRMGDAITIGGSSQPAGSGLPGKHTDVTAQPITAPGKTFSDISGANAHKNQAAIETLAARGIINGFNETEFCPDATMTRAQFAAIVVRGLGLPQKTTAQFTDVKTTDWFAPWVGSAHAYGIVNGRSAATFDPNGTITRQEAAVMVARAAQLCGLDTAVDSTAVRDILAQFSDYVTTDAWAREGLAFCYDADILDQSDLAIRPKEPVRRCEVAQMICNLLGSAKLL